MAPSTTSIEQETARVLQDLLPGLDANSTGTWQTRTKAEIDAKFESVTKQQIIPRLQTLKQFQEYALQKRSEGFETIQVDLDENVSISSFLPDLAGSGLDSLQLTNTSLVYRFEGTDNDLPGAYLTTEVQFVNALQDVAAIVSELTGLGNPILRLHGYLGLILLPDEAVKVDAFTLGGMFLGLPVQSPVGLSGATLSTLGFEIRVGQSNDDDESNKDKSWKDVVAEKVTNGVVTYVKKKTAESDSKTKIDEPATKGDKKTKSQWMKKTLTKAGSAVASYVQLRLFGSMYLVVPNQKSRLLLNFNVQNTGQVIDFQMWPGNDKKWDDAFGFDWLDLEEVSFSAKLDLNQLAKGEEKKAEKTSNAKETEMEAAPQHIIPLHHKRTISKVDLSAAPTNLTKKAKAPKAPSDWKKEAKLFQEVEDSDDEDEKPGSQKKDKNQAVFTVSVHAEWVTPLNGKRVIIDGKLRGEDSYLRGKINDLGLDDLITLYNTTQGAVLAPCPVKISAQELSVKISANGLKFKGDLSINDKPCIKGMIRISRSQLCVTASVISWPFGDPKFLGEFTSVNVKHGSLKLLLNSAKEGKGWSGLFHIGGEVELYEKPIRALLQVVRLPSKEWGFIVSGQIDTTLALSEFKPELKGTCFDFALKEVTLVASTITLPSTAVEKIHGFPVRRGVFLCSAFEKVPFIEGKPPLAAEQPAQSSSTSSKEITESDTKTLIKRTSPDDRCFLSIGIPATLGISMMIYLPESMNFELPQMPGLDTVTEVKGFIFEIAVGTSGPEGAFTGTVGIIIGDEPSRDFDLTIRVKAIEGEVAIVTNAVIENPLYLSKRLALGARSQGQLKLGVQCQWIWGSPTPTGGGLQGTLTVDKKRAYQMCLNIGANPMDTIIILDAPRWAWEDWMDICSAMLDPLDSGIFQKMPQPIADVSFEDMKIYASAGGKFGQETTMPGFEIQGTMIWNKKRAFVMAKLGLSGLHLEARIPSFEVGPLTIIGDVEHVDWPGQKFALAHVIGTLEKQSVALKGKMLLFDLWVDSDTHIEYLPEKIFKVNFDLQWNELIKLAFHANMVNTTNLSRPELASFVVDCTLDQRVYAQIVSCLDTVVDELPKLASRGIDSLQKSVQELENARDKLVKANQDELEKVEAELDKERQEILNQMTDANTRREARELVLRATLTSADEQKAKEIADLERAKQSKVNVAETEAVNRHREQTNEENRLRTSKQEADRQKTDATDLLANKKREMASEVVSLIDKLPRDTVNYVSGLFQKSDDEIAQGLGFLKNKFEEMYKSKSKWLEPTDYWSALAAAELMEVAANRFSGLRTDSTYQYLKSSLSDRERTASIASSVLTTFVNNILSTTNEIDNWKKAQVDQIVAVYESGIASANAIVNDAQKAIETFQAEIKSTIAGLEDSLRLLENSAKAEIVKQKREALALAKSVSSDLSSKRTMLDAAKNTAATAPLILQRMAKELNPVGTKFVPEHISLKGKIEPGMKEVLPFDLLIQGKLAGVQINETFQWKPWSPGKNDKTLFEEIGPRIWEVLKESVTK